MKKRLIPTLAIILTGAVAVFLWTILPLSKQGEKEDPVFGELKWENAVAVIPFKNLSGEEEQQYFCDGLTEEVIHRLSQIRNLKVLARATAFAYPWSTIEIRQVQGRLNTGTILEGNVGKDGNRIRITSQLIDVNNGYNIWSESYDIEMKDIFAIQDEIALMIADKLMTQLLDEEKKGLTKRYTENIEAYDLYLRGRYSWNKRSEEGLDRAIENFSRAIDKDPEYALAYIGIADSYRRAVFRRSLYPPEDYFPKAEKAVLKALEIDDTLAEAHTSLAIIKAVYNWDWEEAENQFKRALELNPNDAMTRSWYAFLCLSPTGRHEEAMREAERALELDPLNLEINANIGWHCYHARDWDRAIRAFKNALDIEPEYLKASEGIFNCYRHKGQYDRAMEWMREGWRIAGTEEEIVAAVESAYAESGLNGSIEKMLELYDESYDPITWTPIDKAYLYASLDKRNETLEQLERAYDLRQPMLIHMSDDPDWDFVREDPRFVSLLEKMGLMR